MSTAEAVPWHAAYPSPRNENPSTVTRQDVLEMFTDKTKIAGRDYLLVDLRRNDHEGGTIRGSINLPAQSLYPAIPTLYNMFKAAGIKKLVFYCSSSRGRGPRAAGWFHDHLQEQGDEDMESCVLVGGITGWAKGGSEFVEWMDEFDEAVWKQK